MNQQASKRFYGSLHETSNHLGIECDSLTPLSLTSINRPLMWAMS